GSDPGGRWNPASSAADWHAGGAGPDSDGQSGAALQGPQAWPRGRGRSRADPSFGRNPAGARAGVRQAQGGSQPALVRGGQGGRGRLFQGPDQQGPLVRAGLGGQPFGEAGSLRAGAQEGLEEDPG